MAGTSFLGTEVFLRAALVVGHLLNEICCGKPREIGVLRAAGTICSMAKSACKYVGLPACSDDFWQRGMIIRMPNWRHEADAHLGDGVAGRDYPGHASKAVVGARLKSGGFTGYAHAGGSSAPSSGVEEEKDPRESARIMMNILTLFSFQRHLSCATPLKGTTSQPPEA